MLARIGNLIGCGLQSSTGPLQDLLWDDGTLMAWDDGTDILWG